MLGNVACVISASATAQLLQSERRPPDALPLHRCWMEYRNATEADAPLLARLNRELIEEEWDGGGMSLERLEARIRRWIADAEYRAILFQEQEEPVAYALVSMDEDSAYVRHFYVFREHRVRGVGRRAIE